MIIGSIVLVVVLLKFTSRGRTSLLSLARRTILPYIVRNQQHARARTPQVSLHESVDAEEVVGNSGGNRNLRETDVNVSAESRLQALFPDVTSWDLVSAIRHTTSEQAAVDRLLAQGYVMTKY